MNSKKIQIKSWSLSVGILFPPFELSEYNQILWWKLSPMNVYTSNPRAPSKQWIFSMNFTLKLLN